MLYDIAKPESFKYVVQNCFFKHIQYILRDDLSFGYLIGTKADLAGATAAAGQIVSAEEASDMAYDNGLLFNEVSAIEG